MAINWEWVIECAETSGCHIVIASRDSDYGVTFGGKPVINDWLLQEFRERVSKRRKLMLTDRLSSALKMAEITVTRQEVESEEQFLRQRPIVRADPPYSGGAWEARNPFAVDPAVLEKLKFMIDPAVLSQLKFTSTLLLWRN